jgi:hypothetical protein
MFNRKMIRRLIAGIGLGLGVASLPLAVTAFAASRLVSLSLQGVGIGTLATRDCQGITCKSGDVCTCLDATYALVGNQGFAKGDLDLQLSIDITPTHLHISCIDKCFPATGIGTIKNVRGTVSLNFAISGLERPALNDTLDVFNGTFVVTGGTGKFSTASGGTGAINVSQISSSGGTAQVAITGSFRHLCRLALRRPRLRHLADPDSCGLMHKLEVLHGP